MPQIAAPARMHIPLDRHMADTLRDAAGLAAFWVAAVLMAKLGGVFPVIVQEDGIIESGTALFFALAGIGAAVALARSSRPAAWGDRGVLACIAVLGIVCALDEISFGARIFGWEMPAMEGGGEFDGAHDLFIMAVRLDGRLWEHFGTLAIGPELLILVVLAMVTWRLRGRIATFIGWIMADATRRRAVMAVGLLAVAQLLDLGSAYWISMLEEYSELTASLALLLATVATLRAVSTSARPAFPLKAGARGV